MQNHFQIDSLYILSGVALRLGRRMGLHRDGASLGLSPFETEMRRRLWWQIFMMDLRSSDSSDIKPSTDLFFTDTKKPLNVEDEDLNPGMANLPPERVGITSVVLTLLRCDIVEALRKFTPQFANDPRSSSLGSSHVTLSEKDNLISQIEDLIERKYVQYCNPLNDLHLFTSLLARTAMCKMRLLAHNPRHTANREVKDPQKERDILLSNGQKRLEYAILLHSTQGLRKFMWQLSTSFLRDTLVYVLAEIRHRKLETDVDQIWKLIGTLLSYYSGFFAENTQAIFVVLGNWTLQVWDDYITSRNAEGHPELPTPEFIAAIIEARRPCTDSSSQTNDRNNSDKPVESTTDEFKNQSFRTDRNIFANFDPIDPIDPYDFSTLPSFGLEPNEWTQWDSFMSGQAAEF
jgi:hypothetical protein